MLKLNTYHIDTPVPMIFRSAYMNHNFKWGKEPTGFIEVRSNGKLYTAYFRKTNKKGPQTINIMDKDWLEVLYSKEDYGH